MNELLTNISLRKKTGVKLPLFYFFLARQGCVRMLINNGQRVELREGEGILLNKNCGVNLDYELISTQSDTDIITIRITSEMISQYNYLCYIRSGFEMDYLKGRKMESKDYCHFDFNKLTSHNRELFFSVVNSIEYKDVFPNNSRKENIGNMVLSDEHCLLLSFLLRSNPELELIFHSNSAETIAEKTAKLIMSNYQHSWNVKTLSTALCMSESTFKKKMNREVGSVREFVSRIKIVESLRCLRRTNDSLDEIAENLGFCTKSYFSKVFYKHLGIFPSQVRGNSS
ncbi:helix-turn-helix transcriptional regulator [Salmonella enterica]|nr:helix-turn-helix transcriptional regulator [Salmonella enterica]